MSRPPLAILAAAAASAALAACGGTHHPQTTPGIDTTAGGVRSTATVAKPPPPPILRIVSSLPLQGPEAPQGRAIADGMALALRQRGPHPIDGFRVDYDSYNDAYAGHAFSPSREAYIAGRAATNEHTILYVGDLASGASRLSIPILSAAGIPQIIPGSPSTDLVASSGSSAAQRPQQSATFLRLVASNSFQATAALSFLHSSDPGCKLLALPYGKDQDSADLAAQIKRASAGYGISVVAGGEQVVDPSQPRFIEYFQHLTAHHANCAIYAGTMAEGAIAVTLELNQALPPGAHVVGSAGVCTSAWIDPREGGVPVKDDPDLFCTAPGPPLKATAAGTRFATAYLKTFHVKPDPAAAYGYEAMTLGLDAIATVGSDGGNRSEVLTTLRSDTELPPEPGEPESVIGSFYVTPTGEISTHTPYTVYRASHGNLEPLTTPAAPSSTGGTSVR